MARFTKKKTDIGRPPDEIYFRGTHKNDSTQLHLLDFITDSHQEIGIKKIKEVIPFIKKASITWLNVNGLHDISVMEQIAATFDFDQLILADVMDTQARPKMRDYENCIAISIKMLQLDDTNGTVSVENLSLILTKNVVLSFQEKNGDVFEPIRNRIRNHKKRIMNSGSDFLLFSLLDIVLDNYIYVISNLGEKVEYLEEELLNKPNKIILEEINTVKKELNFIRKNINPAKEMILTLSKIETDLIDDTNKIHYKELLDNINLALESSDSYREILSDQLSIYHTVVSSNLNDIMKVLTIISVIFIPITFIAGIYGTNFNYIPELSFKYSYFIMWAVMIVIVIGMLIYFRNKKWL